MFMFLILHGLGLFLIAFFSVHRLRQLAKPGRVWLDIEQDRLDFIYHAWPAVKPKFLLFLVDQQMQGLNLRSGLESWSNLIWQIQHRLRQRNEFYQQLLIKMSFMVFLTLLLRFGFYFDLSARLDLMSLLNLSLGMAALLVISGWALLLRNPWTKLISTSLNPAVWIQSIEFFFDHQKFFRNKPPIPPKMQAEWQRLSEIFQEGRPCAQSIREFILKLGGLELLAISHAMDKLKLLRPVFEMLIVFLPAVVLLSPLIVGRN